jgi:ankyrin repeat protein
MEKRVANYKFCLYAAQFWGIHVGKVEKLPVVQEAAITFLAHQNKRNSTRQMEEYAKLSHVTSLTNDTLLHVIVRKGLVTICQLVLCGGSNRDDGYALAGGTRRPNYHRTLSRIPILNTLQTTETDLTAKNIHEETPLYLAAELGHRDMVQFLLDQGADVNESGGFGNALQAALAYRYEAIVQLLLDQGADTNVPGKFYSKLSTRLYSKLLTRLYSSAPASGHLIQLLLNRGADINAMGIHGSALQSVSASSHESVVQLLLNQAADANATGPGDNRGMGPDYSTALQVASVNCRLAVAQLLLNHGADVNASGGFYGNALQAAVVNGHKSTVILLLDQGADINATGGHYGSALGAAAAYGHELAVRFQLKQMIRR